jgi:ABC-type multidrug transport system fused ATPase/permease subunit
MVASERRETVVLLGLMTLGMLLETLSVGLVIPALAFMTQSDIGASFPALSRWLPGFGAMSREQLVVYGLLALVLIYVVKGAFLAFLAWRKLRFVFGLQAQMSRRLFAGYMRQPYVFHLQRNSAELIRNALGEVHFLTQHGLIEALRFVAESLVVIGIIALLLYIEPVGAGVSIATLLLFGGGFYWLTRKAMLRWGEARQHHERMRLQHLQEGLGGVKDVRLLGREDRFIDRYGEHADGFARVGRMQNTVQELPRLMLEVMAVGALAALVITLISRGNPLNSLLPTVGLFAAAAFRIMPSVNRIMTAIQVMRHALPVVTTLASELEALAPQEAPGSGSQIELKRELRVEDVNFSYPSTEAPALHDISLEIHAGESIGFVGGSGSGKSTLIDVILGLLAPQRGVIRVDGVDVRENLRSWQDHIGYVRQHIYLTDDSLRRNIAFGLRDADIDNQAVQRALRAAQLEDFVASLPQGLDTLVGERGVRLSGGQLQRIGIARALYHDPSVLVLDEATSALDTATEREVMSAVRALHGEKTVIIVAHRLTTVADCDRLYRLENGRIVQSGDPATLIPGDNDERRAV